MIMKNLMRKGMNKAAGWMMELRKEERGASDLVAIVALIVIVLAVALIFKNQLINIVNVLGSKVVQWVNNG
jgi:hypothetical protein